jgi:hypothetical protein
VEPKENFVNGCMCKFVYLISEKLKACCIVYRVLCTCSVLVVDLELHISFNEGKV